MRRFRPQYIAIADSSVSAPHALRVSDSALRRAMSDSVDASPITAAHAGSGRSRGPRALQYQPELGLGLPASGQLPNTMYGLPSRRRFRAAGARTLHTSIVGVVFRVERRARLCHSGARRRSIAAVQRGYGRPAQLDGPALERRTPASRIHRLFRCGGTSLAWASAGPRQHRPGESAPDRDCESPPLSRRQGSH
jgi:hypothetical protein